VAFGQRGVVQVMNILQSELATDMGMAGTGRISEIDRSYVRILT
jgi:isopentenyl diphosphate isomerase/L-lactate dehydrogenase-like FMN-dependent dehydrogenase